MAIIDSSQFQKYKELALKKYFGRMNPQQQEAVFTIHGPLLVLAGAGSGKTTVIVNRIANMVRFGDAFHTEITCYTEEEADFVQKYAEGLEQDDERLRDILAVSPIAPWQILSITFTNKAAQEMKNRLTAMLGEEAMELCAATFHSACSRILRSEIHNLGYERSFTIYDSDDSQKLMKACITDLGFSEKNFPPKTILGEISHAKDSLLTPEVYQAQNENDFRKNVISKLYAEYQSRMKKNNAVDFDDIIMLTVQLFQQFPDILRKYQNRYRYILVDEYQDTNHAQFKLVSLLSAQHKNLCVVGDDDQSIYQFRGATVENILGFESQFEHCKVIRLEQNYRSTQNILTAANSVISHNTQRKAKALWTAGDAGKKITWYKASDERDEANYVCKCIEANIKKGAKYSEHAILYRMRAQSNAIEQAMRHFGMKYRVFGGLRFYDRKEIKDITSYLAVLNNHTDFLRFKRIVNEPKRGIGDTTVSVLEDITRDLEISPLEVLRNAEDFPRLSKKAGALKSLAKIFDTLAEKVDTIPLPEFLDLVMEQTGYREALLAQKEEGIERLQNIEELKSSMVNYMQESEEPTLGGFLEEISLYTDQDMSSDSDDVVTLMTIHSAKGLEYRYVFVVGMEDNIFPSSRAMNEINGIDEERRLAYVAITRAKEELTLSNASQRMLFGTTTRNPASAFLREMDASVVEIMGQSESNIGNRSNGSISEVRPFTFQKQLASQKKKTTTTSATVQQFSVGERVKHKAFGEGTILSVSPMASDSMLEVAFDRVGTKKIMAKFANIQKLS